MKWAEGFEPPTARGRGPALCPLSYAHKNLQTAS